MDSTEGLSDLELQWLQYGKWMLWEGFEYFQSVVLGQLRHNVSLYKCARLCNPMSMRDYQFSPQTVRNTFGNEQVLKFAPVLATIQVDSLIDELPAYTQAAGSIDEAVSCKSVEHIMPFWASRHKELPTWSKLVTFMATVVPSSAAAERVFSILKSQFGDTQTAALDDYVSASCMLRFNGREAA